MWRPVAALRLNSTPVIDYYYPFILYLKTFCGMSDCILNENIILYYYIYRRECECEAAYISLQRSTANSLITASISKFRFTCYDLRKSVSELALYSVVLCII